MAKEVLLMNDIKHLGLAGDIVIVKDGYARNFLFPQGHAELVTKNALRKLEKLRKERAEVTRIRKAEATAKATKLEGLAVAISAKTVDESRLYGSVSAGDVAAAISAKGVLVDRTQLQITEAFKEVGTYDVVVALTTEISATVKLTIVAE